MKSILNDISLKNYDITVRVEKLKEIYFKAAPEVCVERIELITDYCKKNLTEKYDKKKGISVLDKANLYKNVLCKRKPVVFYDKYCKKDENLKLYDMPRVLSLFAGSTTTKFKGVPLYPEFLALTLWPELGNMSRRKSNPYYIENKEKEKLNKEIFPYWLDKSLMELVRSEANEEELDSLNILNSIVFFLVSKPNCLSHTIPNFSHVIYKGCNEMIREAGEMEEKSEDLSVKEFYKAVKTVLEGIIQYSKNLAEEAKRLAQNPDYKEFAGELNEIHRIYDKIPAGPSETLREGLTAIWICWTAMHLENANVGLSLGRLDQVLYKLYEKDIENIPKDDKYDEKIDLYIKDAIELFSCLWLKIGDHVPTVASMGEQLFGGTGSNQAITIGGTDRDGKDAVNDLTYIILRVTELMRLRDPNLNGRYCKNVNSEEYMKRLCEVNVTTGATPAIHNDHAVIKALTDKGDTIEDARDYGVIGCVEPGSNGRFYGHTGAILLNLTSALELTMFNGTHRHTGKKLISIRTGEPENFKDFGEFKTAFKKQAEWMMERATNLNNKFGRIHQKYHPTPILSSFFEGPMAKGKDLIFGGAKINSSGATIIGIADVADSLSVIEYVYNSDELDMKTLKADIESDFEKWNFLLKKFQNPDKIPIYGNENPESQKNMEWILELMDTKFRNTGNYRGGHYRTGYWSMTNHAGFGRIMKASPNARKGGENFASGITPVSGRTPALTKTLNSVADLPAKYLSSGVALNLKFIPEPDDKDMIKNFAAYVEGYFSDKEGSRDGGMEIQFNIIDYDTFLKAVECPDNYPELLVRVSGYTAYFKDLNPQMQKEIIDRTEYMLSTGSAIPREPFVLPSGDGDE